MKYSTLLLIFILTNLLACTYDNPESLCVDRALEQYGMRKYQGEHIQDWNDYLVKYEWEGDYYFQLVSTLADVFMDPTNCAGVEVFKPYTEESYSQFEQEYVYVGIVGIR